MNTNTDWNDLYEYVKKEIMEYNDNIKMPRFIIYRLRGLSKGQFMANKKQKLQADYSFKTILYTFKMCKFEILNGFKSNDTKFNNEQHKFNYAMVIIENNINDIVLRLKRIESAKEQAVELKLDNIEHEGAEYQTKTKKENKKLEELW